MYSCVHAAECLQHLPVLVSTHPALREWSCTKLWLFARVFFPAQQSPQAWLKPVALIWELSGNAESQIVSKASWVRLGRLSRPHCRGFLRILKKLSCQRMRSAVSSTHTRSSAETTISTKCGAWLVGSALHTQHHFLRERVLTTAPNTEMRKCVFRRETDDQGQRASKAP